MKQHRSRPPSLRDFLPGIVNADPPLPEEPEDPALAAERRAEEAFYRKLRYPLRLQIGTAYQWGRFCVTRVSHSVWEVEIDTSKLGDGLGAMANALGEYARGGRPLEFVCSNSPYITIVTADPTTVVPIVEIARAHLNEP